MELTESRAKKELKNFFKADLHPPMIIIGSGISCTIDGRFGMDALKKHLTAEIPKSAPEKNQEEWELVKTALTHGSDLENALNNVTSPSLISTIVETTGKFIASLDEDYFTQILSGEKIWKPIDLMGKILSGRTAANPSIIIVTTNYDNLIEYALEAKSIPYNLGFYGGVIRNYDWNVSEKIFQKHEPTSFQKKKASELKIKPHFVILKVHGSLNTFLYKAKIVELESMKWHPKEGFERMIVTPGMNKYEKVLSYREELIAEFDKKLKIHQGCFLLLGYGLNDNHIDKKIQEKLKKGARGLLLTKGSNDRIDALINNSENLWLVCSDSKDGISGTKIFNKSYSNALFIPNKNWWDTSDFTKEILG